ncbi:hypothetical protein DFH07DRAFT_999886 [Mycena maculata]|uniref:F-box domain-containing protein n=1 Tax=Mycena maculata TaxID=230809 RepID=A0AAD7HUC5_9AGAR|nr:hypothetical protein DFH07DRAFT_999886 [Mycena maculata]
MAAARHPRRGKFHLTSNVPALLKPQICWDVGPQELYALSRTSKSLRTFLTSKSNAGPIWRRAFKIAVDEGCVPPTPPDMTCELQWANILFGDFCFICLHGPGENICWAFNARYCKECFPFQVQKRLPNALARYLPRTEWRGLVPFVQAAAGIPLYSSQEMRVFAKEYLSLHTEEECAEYVERQRQRTAVIQQYAETCKAWCAEKKQTDAVAQWRAADIRDTASYHENLVRTIARWPWYRTASLPTNI